MKVVFFGTPRLAQIILENLIASDYKPQLVITGPDTKFGRGQIVKQSPVKKTAAENRIDILQAQNLSEKNLKFDLAILEAFGKIIPAEILKLPKYGFLNVHPSILPKYRGPSPIQSAILSGDKKTGVSIIRLDEEVDHGPIIAQQEVPVEDFDTHETLVEKLGAIGSNLLIKTIPDYLSGKIKPEEQNHSLATFTKKITKSDGQIDLENPPNPQQFDRMIRAFFPWPGVWSVVETGNLRIRFLPKGLMQMEGKRPLTIAQLKNGYPVVYAKMSKLYPPNRAQS